MTAAGGFDSASLHLKVQSYCYTRCYVQCTHLEFTPPPNIRRWRAVHFRRQTYHAVLRIGTNVVGEKEAKQQLRKRA